MPVGSILCTTVAALGRASRLEGRFGGEMCLANKRSVITVRREGAGKTRFPHLGIEINPIVPHAVGEWQQSRQDRGARWLTHQVGRHAGGKTRALGRQCIDMWCLDMPVLKTKAIGTLLIGRDQKNIRSTGHARCPSSWL